MTENDDRTLFDETPATPKIMTSDVKTIKKFLPYLVAIGVFGGGNTFQYGLTAMGITDPSGAQAIVSEDMDVISHISEIYTKQINDLIEQREVDAERYGSLKNELLDCRGELQVELFYELDYEDPHE